MEITQVTRDHFYEGEKPNESSTFSLICGKRKKWNVKDHKKTENFLRYQSIRFL